jgi:uncharacterized protein YbaP (TraB family)
MKPRKHLAWTLLAACLAGGVQAAATPAAATEATPAMAAVEVSGLQPGPSLWRVSRGEHEMWILGTISPVPKRMQWDSADVDAVIRDSQLVLGGPSVMVTSKVGFFGKLALIPKLLGARKNPGKETLQEVLPAATYARWQRLADQYFGSTRSLEKRRPIFVAQELYEEALDETGLRADAGVTTLVAKSAKRAKVEMQYPRLKVEVPDMKALLADFSKTSLDDIACFEQMMTYVENDLPTMRWRAEAWAIGDVDALRAINVTQSYDTCVRSLFSAPGLAKHGFENLNERMRATWLEAAENALKTHRSTFAVLPISQLLSDSGYAADLRKRGYTVEAPGEASPEEATEASSAVEAPANP